MHLAIGAWNAPYISLLEMKFNSIKRGGYVMLRLAHLGLPIALFLCFPISNAEAGMNKCTNGKQITYTNEPCEKHGLKSAGPIKNAVTVMPAAQNPQNNPAENSDKKQAVGNDAPKDKASSAVTETTTIKPANPLADKKFNQ